jgi:hypothetical protein
MAWGALGGDGYRSRRRSQPSRTSQPGSYTKSVGYTQQGVADRLRHEPFALA